MDAIRFVWRRATIEEDLIAIPPGRAPPVTVVTAHHASLALQLKV